MRKTLAAVLVCTLAATGFALRLGHGVDPLDGRLPFVALMTFAIAAVIELGG